MMQRVIAHVWYPLFTGAAITAFGFMLAAGKPLLTAAYLPVIGVGLAIVILEWKFPEHLEWRPRARDICADAAFMALVQVGFARLLAALAAITIAAWTHEHARSALWPHEWPLWSQAIVMVLAVDFVRYWLHRACHRYGPLWRLHEVHHSPDILYVLNVGRFHPLEKALQFCCDSVPFLILGVAPELIACYFLLYSVNGLFQHSNVRLRYGWLNYIVGSAETHRWHHARDPRTAACNFGNTTIVWDLLFGTWHLPRHALDAIGIPDRTYPKGFWAQMQAPFWRREAPLRRTRMAWAANMLVDLRLRAIRLIRGWRIASDLKDPMRVQRAVLSRIVFENRRTAFGKQHRFSEISSIEDFVERVSVSEYERLRPYIESEIEHGESALTAQPPERYARTSGTTGRPKDIPLNTAHLAALRRIHQTSVAFQHRTCSEAFAGAILAIVSPAIEGFMPNGKPFGSASGMVAGNTPRLVQQKFVLPSAVLAIADSRLKYLTILRLGLARPDITYVGSANATTLLTLMKLFRQHQADLIRDLRLGGFFCADQLSDELKRIIGPRLIPAPARAHELEQLSATRRDVRLSDVWPQLRLVVTWTCASAGIAVDALRRELSSHTRIFELGYLSSEFRATVTLGRRAGSGMPTLDTHFFEFAEREAWDRGEREVVTLDQVRKGTEYYVIVTTPSGLYRYFMNDVVRVTGFLHRTPLLKFSQKGKGVTNITGEKLYETQVLAAVRAVSDGRGATMGFLMMLADEAACAYRLYVEGGGGAKPSADAFAVAVDAKLCELNIEYHAKRESGRLGALTAVWLVPGTGEAYKQFCVRAGQREGQFKTVALAYRREFNFDLEARAEGFAA